MRYFHEVRKEVVRNGHPILVEVGGFVPLDEYNFRSTFDYPFEIAQQIRTNGNTAGLKGLPVSAFTVYIDVDENKDVEGVRDTLKSLDIAYEEYKTGNRGAHFHIPLAARITGTGVVYTVIDWLKRADLWHRIDTSIYREGGQFRLESATHSKTGKKKLMVDDVDGQLLNLIQIEEPPKKSHTLSRLEGGDRRDFYMNLMQKRGVGQRHMHIFILWQSGRAAGLDESELEEAILLWNDNQDEPHTAEMMQKKLNGFKEKELRCTKRV